MCHERRHLPSGISCHGLAGGLVAALALVACGGGGKTGSAGATGGSTATTTGGTRGSGGGPAAATGGSSQGGAVSTGGLTGTGGRAASGGVSGTGGAATGGSATGTGGGGGGQSGQTGSGATGGGHSGVGGGAAGGSAPTGGPSGLLVELTAHPDRVGLTDSTPDFAWIVQASGSNQMQTAYRILVASKQANLDADSGDMWDSGKTPSNASINVSYAGKALAAGATYYWKVMTWDSSDSGSPWSYSQPFTMAGTLGAYSTAAPPVEQTSLAPMSVTQLGTGHTFIDFGRAAFGWFEITLDAPVAATMSVAMGEKAKGQSVDANPGGSIRYELATVKVAQGQGTYRVHAAANGGTIAIPAALGVLMPFRYVEVTGAPVTLTKDAVRQIAVSYPFDDGAAAFSSSNTALDQVWALAKYSIKATTFADIYVDGDRERKPYEADAYIQQLGHYAIDRDYALARKSHEYLMANPTWPTEWKFHSIMMAWADWTYTGNLDSLAKQYAALKQSKTLESYVNADGLLDTGSLMDIVDWPEGERDGYVLTPVNTVVNAFWCYSLGLMADMADALGNASDASRYRTMATTATAALNSKLWSASTGLYVDGQTSTHSSLHANMFPLAFGLVPADRQTKVVAFIQSRGMACSVYGAQYLLEALYRAGQPNAALALLTATSDRGWLNMLNVGSTITLEAWDAKYKPNLDWNHAWGAAPANILPRYLLGVRPGSPGFAKAIIQPQPGSLTHVEGIVATIRGPIQVVVDSQPLALTVTIPANMTADVAVPPTTAACSPSIDGQPAKVTAMGGVTWIQGVGSGQHAIRCP